MQARWAKVVYKEVKDSDEVFVRQGYLYDKGEFVLVEGDYKVTEIRKECIISTEYKKEKKRGRYYENDI
ncbi:MAG: hypothetical protein ACFFG0_50610 [Candidatus Thorarchaeota archaeon]